MAVNADQLSALVDEQEAMPNMHSEHEGEEEEEEEEEESADEGMSVAQAFADLIAELHDAGDLEDSDKVTKMIDEWVVEKEEAAEEAEMAASEEDEGGDGEEGEEGEEGEGAEPTEDTRNPPEWATNPAIWAKAEEAVDPEGAGAEYNEPYAVVTHIYQKMGGGIS